MLLVQLSEKVRGWLRRGLMDPLSYVQRHVRGDWGEIDEPPARPTMSHFRSGQPDDLPVRITPELGVDREDQRRPPDHGGTSFPEERDLI